MRVQDPLVTMGRLSSMAAPWRAIGAILGLTIMGSTLRFR
jgi:hypothetical protein